MGTIINAPIMPLAERLTTASDVKEFTMEIQNQIFYKDVLFFRAMLVSPKMENGKQVINPEDGDTLDEVYAVVDCNIIKKDGKIRFNIVKTAVDSKKELIQETMNLVGGEADASDLIVHLVNVLNTLLPEAEQDHDDSDIDE
jgi:hypothetical protein